MDSDVARGLQPLIVIASAGATSTGSVDALPELAELCRSRGVWLHVDAAYGGFAVLSERGGEALAGMALCDSITLDPHKWLYMPFEVGCLLVREGRLLRSAFEVVPHYLEDTRAASREVNFANHGLQLTRAARSIKVWLSLKYFGVGAFRAAIDRAMDLALVAQERIEASERLELVTPARLGVLTFRRRFPGVEDEDEAERLNAELVRMLAESGEGLLSSTRLRGRYVIRFCVMNHTSLAPDVHRVLDFVERAKVEVDAARRPSPPEHVTELAVNMAWLARPTIDTAMLGAIPLFRDLGSEQVARVLAAAREETVAPGENAVTQWQYSRAFYVILHGTAEVRAGGRRLARLGPGDFFGENAAIDWGAGFSIRAWPRSRPPRPFAC